MRIAKSKFLLFSFFLTAFLAKAQETASKLPIDPDTKLVTYKEVVQIPGTPNELFNRVIEWVNKQYKNPTEATKVRNPATGLIEISHRIEVTRDDKGTPRLSGVVVYNMKIEVKEGRYRYTITNFNIKDVSLAPIERWLDKKDKAYSPLWDDYLRQVDDYTNKLIASLKAGMVPPAPKKVDEW